MSGADPVQASDLQHQKLLRSVGVASEPERLRKPGGGRKKSENKDLTMMNHLEDIMKESTAGDPMSPMKSKNCDYLAIITEHFAFLTTSSDTPPRRNL